MLQPLLLNSTNNPQTVVFFASRSLAYNPLVFLEDLAVWTRSTRMEVSMCLWVQGTVLARESF